MPYTPHLLPTYDTTYPKQARLPVSPQIPYLPPNSRTACLFLCIAAMPSEYCGIYSAELHLSEHSQLAQGTPACRYTRVSRPASSGQASMQVA